MRQVIFGIISAMLILGIMSIAETHACIGQNSDETKPYYNCGTHVLINKFKVEKSDCFDEIYAAARLGSDKSVLLNKQTYHNNDKPDAGPTDDKGTFRWLFTGSKVPDGGTIRVYMEIWGVKDNLIETKTKYIHDFDPKIKEWDVSKLLGYFHLYAQPTLCQ